MKTFTLLVWENSGPRDQTNCLYGWGRRKVTVQAESFDRAVIAAICLVGRENYGGLVETEATNATQA